jgi:hypothetical protein
MTVANKVIDPEELQFFISPLGCPTSSKHVDKSDFRSSQHIIPGKSQIVVGDLAVWPRVYTEHGDIFNNIHPLRWSRHHLSCGFNIVTWCHCIESSTHTLCLQDWVS